MWHFIIYHLVLIPAPEVAGQGLSLFTDKETEAQGGNYLTQRHRDDGSSSLDLHFFPLATKKPFTP